MEPVPLATLRSGAAEVCFRQVRGAGPAHHGVAIGRPEAQPAFDADRRRRSSRQVVLPTKAGMVGVTAQRHGIPASDGWSGNAKMAQLSGTLDPKDAYHKSGSSSCEFF